MSNADDVPYKLPLIMTYRNLRLLFMAGLVLEIVMLFVPAYRATIGGEFGIGGEVRTFSSLGLIRLIFQAGSYGWGFYYMGCYSAWAALLVLAYKEPSRWVFLSGASLTAFVLALAFFMGRSPDIEYFLVPTLIDYAGAALVLTGFWIRPPAPPNQ